LEIDKVFNKAISWFAYWCIASTALAFILFLSSGRITGELTLIGIGDKFAAPAALVWKATAEVLARGIHAIPASALMFAMVAIVATVVVTVVEQLWPRSKRYLPSPTGLGLAFVIPFSNSVAIFIGAVVAALCFRFARARAERYTITVSSGLIAGESIMAVILIGLKRALGLV
jgi:uncharacterized oligopeptide transporter (OPT) family protein